MVEKLVVYVSNWLGDYMLTQARDKRASGFGVCFSPSFSTTDLQPVMLKSLTSGCEAC